MNPAIATRRLPPRIATMLRLPIILLTVLLAGSWLGSAEEPGAAGRPAPLPFLLSMVHHNPGEPLFLTKYERPAYLTTLGINGDAARFFFACALTYDGYEPGLVDPGGAAWAWIKRYEKNLRHLIAEHQQAGLPLYPFTDILVIPREVMAKYGSEMKDDKGQLSIARERTKAIVVAQIDELFRRFPELGGLTLRFGETYLTDTPHHLGGRPVHSVDDHVTLVGLLREEVCVKRNRKLFYRTWDFGGLHTRPDQYRALSDRIEPHPNLLFSVKHSGDDFLRNVPFNRTIGLGRHRQIIEVSTMQAGCYGKGAYPYYIGRGVLHGWSEMADRKGLSSLVGSPMFAGMFVWPRGDGWSGPYIPNEFWSDLNMQVLCGFARRPWLTDEQLFREHCRERLHLDEAGTAKLYELCLLSEQAVLDGAQSVAGNVQAWWQRDDTYTDPPLAKVPPERFQAMRDEKAASVAAWRRIEALAREVRLPVAADQDYLEVSSTYGRIHFSICDVLWRLDMLMRGPVDDTAKAAMRQGLATYDALWQEWRTLEREHACCPTLYVTRFPQTFPPTWRETPEKRPGTPSWDTPMVARCRALLGK